MKYRLRLTNTEFSAAIALNRMMEQSIRYPYEWSDELAHEYMKVFLKTINVEPPADLTHIHFEVVRPTYLITTGEVSRFKEFIHVES